MTGYNFEDIIMITPEVLCNNIARCIEFTYPDATKWELTYQIEPNLFTGSLGFFIGYVNSEDNKSGVWDIFNTTTKLGNNRKQYDQNAMYSFLKIKNRDNVLYQLISKNNLDCYPTKIGYINQIGNNYRVYDDKYCSSSYNTSLVVDKTELDPNLFTSHGHKTYNITFKVILSIILLELIRNF